MLNWIKNLFKKKVEQNVHCVRVVLFAEDDKPIKKSKANATSFEKGQTPWNKGKKRANAGKTQAKGVKKCKAKNN